MTPRYEVTFTVAAEHQPDVRDLADAIRDAVRAAQRAGQYPDVELAGGPTVAYLADLPAELERVERQACSPAAHHGRDCPHGQECHLEEQRSERAYRIPDCPCGQPFPGSVATWCSRWLCPTCGRPNPW